MLNDQKRKNRLPPLVLMSRHWAQDLDEIQCAISENIIDVKVTPLKSQASLIEGYLAHTNANDLEISFLRYGANVQVQFQHDDTYAIAIPLKGCLNIEHNQPPCHNDLMHIIPPFVELDMTFSHDCEQLILRFKKSYFHDTVFSPIMAKGLSKQQHYLTSKIRENCAIFLSDCNYASKKETITALIKELQQSIYDTLLLKNKVATQARSLKNNNIAQHAIQFIDENPSWDYNINELTNLFGLSARTLYSQFQSQVHISPYRYYQNRQLCRARLDLLRYGRHFSIAEIATYNGFNHLGRFASQYEKLFRELPSSTLVNGK